MGLFSEKTLKLKEKLHELDYGKIMNKTTKLSDMCIITSYNNLNTI